jgi:hypothetical protein
MNQNRARKGIPSESERGENALKQNDRFNTDKKICRSGIDPKAVIFSAHHSL